VSSLGQVFGVLDRMRDEGVVADYAIGGATAVLFYAEPARTYDVAVFVAPVRHERDALVSLAPIYDWTRAQGFGVEAEHILVHGVPVQVLPVFNALVAEAVEHARVCRYDTQNVRVVGPEYLIALALQAGGSRRRERAWTILETARVDRDTLREIVARHAIEAAIPDDV
jgi:hypothetical protein